MSIKKLFISIIKSLIIIILTLLIFSTATDDLQNLVKGIFGDIFEYSSSDAQEGVLGVLIDTCSSLGQSENLLMMSQVCTNQSLLESLNENCKNNKLEEKKSLSPDLSKTGELCNDYKARKISGKEFFVGVISSAFGTGQILMPKLGIVEKYNAIKSIFDNKLLSFIVLSVLIIMLFLLIKDIALFLIALSGILFSIGTFIMVPYLGILAYKHFSGIDTTPLLSSLFGGGVLFEPHAFISLLLLGFLKIYNWLIIFIGSTFLVIGVSGKVYWFVYKRRLKVKKESEKEAKIDGKAEKKDNEKSDKEFGKIKKPIEKKKN